MLLVTTEQIAGRNVELLGIVEGSSIQTVHAGKDIMNSLKTLVGGELTSYTEMMEKAQLMKQKEEADKRKQEYEILLGQKRKKELEIHEIELAMKAIEEAASQVQKTFGQELNEKISEIFCDMTNGKYTQAVMDENLSMMVYDGFDHVDMKYLSNATVEQLYFALRLASADLLYENDAFPLFLDDVFGNYDDERLAQTMQYLSHHTDRQIFLFTGRKEILRLLDEKEILYHLISL